MSSVLCSQGVVLATAMAVSGTVILLALCRPKAFTPPQQLPRSCISSGGLSFCWVAKEILFSHLSPLTSQSLFLKFSRFVCFVCRWEEEGEGEREGEGEEEEEEEKGALRRGRGGSKWGQ